MATHCRTFRSVVVYNPKASHVAMLDNRTCSPQAVNIPVPTVAPQVAAIRLDWASFTSVVNAVGTNTF